MKKYRLKVPSPVFEAAQIPRIKSDDMKRWGELAAWLGAGGPWKVMDRGRVSFDTPDGHAVASPGEWIVRSADGRAFGIVDDQTFRTMYEEVEE